jgi:hypothetical protein
MSRREIENKKELSLLRVFENLDEVFNSSIATDFKEIDYGKYITYEFNTNSGTKYDLEFHHSYELCDTELDSGLMLGKLVLDECPEFYGKINCFDVAFTTSSVIDKDNPDEYERETNKYEYIELMGRITYIIKQLINKHKSIKLFVIGNSRRNKMDMYKLIFKNNFNDLFDLHIGKSIWREGDSFFIIKK